MADDKDLPLHAEAKARAKWRRGETIIEAADAAGAPASEVGKATKGDDASPDAPRVDLRPPD